MARKKIYLAGPDVFLAEARAVGDRKRALCWDFGFEGLFPLDNDEDVRGNPARIFRDNCALMQQADVGLFNLTPFRGPSADAGTVFELGFLFVQGKPIYGYTSAPQRYRERVARSGPLVEQNGLRDRDGYAVEDFDLIDNLMIVRAIEDAGGVFAAVANAADGTDGDPLAAFRAFTACLEVMRRRILLHEIASSRTN
jgi:nucleoside 2-deoxyribosyltransferase